MANIGTILGLGIAGAAALGAYALYANRDAVARATISGITTNITDPFISWFGSLFGESEDTPETASDPEMNPTPATAPDPETSGSNSGSTIPQGSTQGSTTPGSTTTYTHSGFRSSEATSTARVYRSPGSSGSSSNRNNINNPSNARGSSGGYALPHLRPSPAVSTGAGSSVITSSTYASRGRASLPAWLR